MSIASKLENLLDNSHVAYSVTAHPVAYTARQVAAVEHIPADEVAKPVILAEPKGYVMAVVPGDSDVNMKSLRRALGASQLRLASEEEIENLFPDVEVGAMPPIGDLYGLPMIVDRSLSEHDEIVFNGGTHREAVHMKFEDYRRVTRPKMADFTRTRN
jgi:Ala-tRNA(Pro) deacylase